MRVERLNKNIAPAYLTIFLLNLSYSSPSFRWIHLPLSFPRISVYHTHIYPIPHSSPIKQQFYEKKKWVPAPIEHKHFYGKKMIHTPIEYIHCLMNSRRRTGLIDGNIYFLTILYFPPSFVSNFFEGLSKNLVNVFSYAKTNIETQIQ